MSWSLETTYVSRFFHAKDAKPERQESLAHALESIRGDAYKNRVIAAQMVLDMSEEAYKEAKAMLPCWTMCGTFEPRRAISCLKTFSGIVQGDVDGLSECASKSLQDALRSDSSVVYAFVSPSGLGLKYGVFCAEISTDAEYKRAWSQISASHKRDYGVKWDQATKDISRLCFASWDPDIHINPRPEPFSLSSDEPTRQRTQRYVPQNYDSQDEQARAEEALRYISPNCDYATWCNIGMALHSTGAPWAFSLYDSWSSGGDEYAEREIQGKWASFGRDGIGMGTLFHHAREHGWRSQPKRITPDMTMSQRSSILEEIRKKRAGNP